MRCANPFAFGQVPVTFWVVTVYAAILISLLVIHETVPQAQTPSADLEEAWSDLKSLSQGYHPYNSRQNDLVRIFLRKRIKEILNQNGASWTEESLGASTESIGQRNTGMDVVVFDDNEANFTMTASYGILGARPGEKRPPGTGTYFEGTNVYVYIRGKQDADGDWWTDSKYTDKHHSGGVLVNAHYDSVSTGYGATDDGMGVVTVLQLIKHFGKKENQPEHGIIALLNNGEEDYLWGARAFGQSRVMPFVNTFLNLEGAGAGGRALLFRSSDQEVTKAYGNSKNPFGSVLASDGFELGLIRSQTDFVIFNGIFGQRGLDLAFYRPRARYHTNQDDIRHTTRASLSHMLESSRATMASLSGDTGSTFTGRRKDGDRHKTQNGSPSNGVWFDLFGSSFAVFGLKTLFAWSLTLLIVSPIILMTLTVVLVKCDKYYFFTNSVKSHEDLESEAVGIHGMRGLFRFPLALIISTGFVVGGAFLLKKANPLIVYSSEYSVWAMFISLFFMVFWFLMRGAAFIRPSALHRGYALIWIFSISWCFLVVVTVFEDRFHIAAGYAFVFFHGAAFLALFISFCELFALPKLQIYAQDAREDREDTVSPFPSIHQSETLIVPSAGDVPESASGETTHDNHDSFEVPTENTPLVPKSSSDPERTTTFATGYRRQAASITSQYQAQEPKKKPFYRDEQQWSANIPSWTWFLQFLILCPFNILLIGQIGLLISAAVSQTGADGSSLIFPYMAIAAFSSFLLLPITPFIHRISYHVPTFLFLVFLGTLIYNITAFPFSEVNRYKVYFQQTLDIPSGETKVKLVGLQEYVVKILDELPAARSKAIDCNPASRVGLVSCEFDGVDVPPRLSVTTGPGGYEDLIQYNVTRIQGENQAFLEIEGANTKACFVRFDDGITINKFDVKGATYDSRYGGWPESGLSALKLWRRDWETPWRVSLEWAKTSNDGWHWDVSNAFREAGIKSDELKERDYDSEKVKTKEEDDTTLSGRIVCIWSDANVKGTIPALDEALQYAPRWAAITKLGEGLVEASVPFQI